MFCRVITLAIAVTHGAMLSAQKISTVSPSSRNSIAPVGIVRNISDSVLLDIVQRQTFRYFWNFGHPFSGLARERGS